MTTGALAQVAATGLLRAERPVLVMLSGGRDSTALLDIAVRIAGAPTVETLHVNYGLRPEADGDEAHCRRLCDQLGVAQLHVRHAAARRAAGNLQAWAREQRYAAARELAAPRGADIAVGHTATDQVETILYRLASSPSRRALLGMPARAGGLIRPLLGFTREQTADYCHSRGLAWREDASNASPDYARGRVREQLVPAFRAVHPAAEQNVLALAATLRAENEALDELVDQVLDGRSELELERARALPAALAALVLQRLADGAAGGPAPGTARRAPEILAMAATAALDLPHGVRAVSTRGVLRMQARSANGNLESPR